MKKQTDLKKLRRRPRLAKHDKRAGKSDEMIELDSVDLAGLKSEAHQSGVRYQTLISRVLRRYVSGEIVDRLSPDLRKLSRRD